MLDFPKILSNLYLWIFNVQLNSISKQVTYLSHYICRIEDIYIYTTSEYTFTSMSQSYRIYTKIFDRKRKAKFLQNLKLNYF